MASNVQPIYSKSADIQWSQPLLSAANDYTGNSPFNALVFKADATNGGYIQRIRFKSLGTNVATVARIFINNGAASHLSSLLTTPVAAGGVATPSGGTLPTATYYSKIVAVDSTGALTAPGPESLGVAVTGPSGAITWSWTAVIGAASYRVYVGTASNAENAYFTTATNSYLQTEPVGDVDSTPSSTNNIFYDEIALPATTASAITTTVTIDIPMNFAMPAGYRVYVGLATAVASGWGCSAIAGKY